MSCPAWKNQKFKLQPRRMPECTPVGGTFAELLDLLELPRNWLDAKTTPIQGALKLVGCRTVYPVCCAGFEEVTAPQARIYTLNNPTVVAKIVPVVQLRVHHASLLQCLAFAIQCFVDCTF